MRTKTSKSTGQPEADLVVSPTISIYQNSDHVAGLVQQLFDAPLVTTAVREDHGDATKSRSLEGSVAVEAEGRFKMPFLGALTTKADGAGKGTSRRMITTGSKSTQSFIYSQAYYLNIVRQALRANNLITVLDSDSSVDNLRSGDFVEFKATFSPSELTTLMDVVTPDLVAQITKWLLKRTELSTFDGYDSFEKVRIAALSMNEKANSTADLARDVTHAVQADFRQEKTREYYGRIGEGATAITAITICDNAHFVVDDEDRILDGEFTVLGKVTSGAEQNVPVLQRNKLLRNLSVEGVDALMGQLTNVLATQSSTKIGGVTVDTLIDFKVGSRVAGTSIRVVPIAIYV
jgi:hypothetical protein